MEMSSENEDGPRASFQQPHVGEEQSALGKNPPPNIVENLIQADMSNQDTLRARNNSRTKSIGNAVDLADLFAPPPHQPQPSTLQREATSGSIDPPLPTEAPFMRTAETARGEQRKHGRMPSTIRFAPNHERQVPWGLDNSERNLLQQPSLQDAHITSNLMNQFRRHRGGSGRISIDDLQNTRPMENEAEAYLIKALETRDYQAERKMAESGSVLSNIPREDLDALRVEADNSLLTSPGNSKESAGAQPSTTEGAPSTVGNATSSGVRRPPTMRGRPPPKSSRGHRRNETVGDQLESLAAAMDVFHTQHMDLLNDDDHSDDALPAPLQNKVDATVSGGISSADALQKNANLIYNRHRTQTDDQKDEEKPELVLPSVNSDSSSVSTAASKRWQLLRNNLAATKGSLSDSPSKEGRIGDDSLRIEEEPDVLTSSDDAPSPNDKDGTPPNDEAGKKPTSFEVRPSKNKFVTELEEFFAPRRKTIFHFLRVVILLVIVPSLGVSALLFYFAGNPPTGVVDVKSNSTSLVNESGRPIDPQTASASWWLLFLGVRQVVTFVLAKAVELFFIDFLLINS